MVTNFRNAEYFYAQNGFTRGNEVHSLIGQGFQKLGRFTGGSQRVHMASRVRVHTHKNTPYPLVVRVGGVSFKLEGSFF